MYKNETAKELKDSLPFYPEFKFTTNEKKSFLTIETLLRIKIDGIWKLAEFRSDTSDTAKCNHSTLKKENTRILSKMIECFKVGEYMYPKGKKMEDYNSQGVIDDNQED